MKFFLASAAIAGVEAGTLGITWSDCHAKHTTVTDLQPTTIQTGKTETLTGTATVDEAVATAKFTAVIKARGVQIAACSGDGTSDIVCKLPLGAGAITVSAIDYPMGPGSVSLGVSVKTRANLPASLANCDAHIEAQDGNGEGVVCLDVHTQKSSSFDEEVADCEAEYAEFLTAYPDKVASPERQSRFCSNLETVHQHNDANSDYEMTINHFSDWTDAEIAAMFPNTPMDNSTFPMYEPSANEMVASSIDWRRWMPNVKNQGHCGSCWAFSAMAVVDFFGGSHSEQQLVDCSTDNYGCNGGWPSAALQYLASAGADSESQYTYFSGSTQQGGSCKARQYHPIATISNVQTPSGASGILSALNKQVVAITISCSEQPMELIQYGGGLYSSDCGSGAGHAMAAVGYGQGYWIIRNSWGSGWGESGYARWARGQNLCGLESQGGAIAQARSSSDFVV